jgi:hypothetical protein
MRLPSTGYGALALSFTGAATLAGCAVDRVDSHADAGDAGSDGGADASLWPSDCGVRSVEVLGPSPGQPPRTIQVPERCGVCWSALTPFAALLSEQGERAVGVTQENGGTKLYFFTQRFTHGILNLARVGLRLGSAGPELDGQPEEVITMGKSSTGTWPTYPRPRSDGSEMVVGFAAGPHRLFVLAQGKNGWPLASQSAPLVLVDPQPVIFAWAGPLLEDRRTLVYLVAFPNDDLHLESAVRTSSAAGDTSFTFNATVSVAPTPVYVRPDFNPTLSCDAWHLIYESTGADGSSAYHIAPIVQTAPRVLLGRAENYALPLPADGASHLNLVEGPDCGFLFVTEDADQGLGSTYLASRVPCRP